MISLLLAFGPFPDHHRLTTTNMQLNNLNIAVLGAGRSGRAAARLAMKHGARVRVFDASPSIGNWPEDIPLHAAATEEDGRAFRADLVVISPGIETGQPLCQGLRAGRRGNHR